MPKEFSRTRRLGEQIQRDLSALIRDELNDPRLGMVTINGVTVSRDLSHARVFVTMLDERDESRAQRMAVLNGAAGFLRRELGRMLTTRVIPQLKFEYDDSIERGAKLSKLIDDAVAADVKKHNPN